MAESTGNHGKERRVCQAKQRKRRYLLSGLMVCGVCGHTMHAVTYNDCSIYRCPNGGKNRPEGVPKHSMVIERSVAEEAVAMSDCMPIKMKMGR